MKISVDAGGLCLKQGSRFGNFSFSLNLIKALNQYDKENIYNYYSFCNKSSELDFNEQSSYKILKPRKFWMKLRVSIEELMNRNDIFLALNQSLPFFTKAKIISFSHGLSSRFFPEFYKNDYRRFDLQLNDICKRSEHIVVSSVKVKNELLNVNKNLKIKVIPFGIPFDMKFCSQPERPVVAKTHPGGGSSDTFVFVGMDHPIKNIDFLVKAFLEFKKDVKNKNYRLYLVGNHKDRGHKDIITKNNISRVELRELYSNATAYLTTSFYESFNLPILEALSQGCPVVGLRSAVIPEMQEYVDLVDTKEEFTNKLFELANKNKALIDRKKIIKTFTWQNYVKELIKLY